MFPPTVAPLALPINMESLLAPRTCIEHTGRMDNRNYPFLGIGKTYSHFGN